MNVLCNETVTFHTCFTHCYQVDQHISLCEQYSSSDEVVAGVVANTNIGEGVVCLCVCLEYCVSFERID